MHTIFNFLKLILLQTTAADVSGLLFSQYCEKTDNCDF